MNNSHNIQLRYSLFLGLLFSFCYSSYAQIPSSGLVGYYPFNGNTNDESSYVTHGINSGAVLTNDRFEQANSAYKFNGVDQYI